MGTFDEWAREASPPNRRCKVCALPAQTLAEVKRARDAGYGTITIARFLAAQGYTQVSSSSLENHFRRGGHER